MTVGKAHAGIASAGSNGLPVFSTPKQRTKSLRIAATTICLGFRRPAVDLIRQRLFLAELGNNSVGIIDVKTQTVIRTITGFEEPQGVGYVPSTDTLYVANAGDGSVQLFQGADLSPSGRIELGKDADNGVRFAVFG